MTALFQKYTPPNPNIVIGENVIQLINGMWTSEVKTSLGEITLNGPQSVDNSIETGYVYLANMATNKLQKLTEVGELYKEIDISIPLSVSAINYKTSRKGYIDGGVWVYSSNGELSRYSKELEYATKITGFSGESFIASDTNLNCAIANNTLSEIYLFDRNGNLISNIGYSNFLPSVTGDDIIRIQFDANSDLFVLTKKYLYKVETSSDFAMSVAKKYDLNALVAAYGYEVSDMDIDLLPEEFEENESSSSVSDEKQYHQDIYVVCGDYTNILLLNFNNDCLLVRQKTYSSQAYPYILRLGRGRFSNNIGILTNSNKFNEPDTPWESSSSTSSESSIAPTNAYIGGRDTTRLSRISLDDFSIYFDGDHLVLGSRAVEYNPNNNRVYYISEYTDEIYYHDLVSKTNTLISNAPSINIDRITISPDGTKLWLSKDSVLYVCDIVTGTLDNTINIRLNSLASIESYGGMAIHPTNNKLYIASSKAIYQANTSDVTLIASTLYVTKIANLPSISNNITDICFSNSGEMFVTDDNLSSESRIFQVNYENDIVTYNLISTYNRLIDAMGSGTGI